MTLIFLIIFGALGLIIIFMNWDMLMAGVAIGNSSASAGNYTGFNESINALPWIVPLLFIFVIAIAWWFSHRRG